MSWKHHDELHTLRQASKTSFSALVLARSIIAYMPRIELDSRRKIRSRNKLHYRLSHWPIWIAVFFLTPGPWISSLFEHGGDYRLLGWLCLVLLCTGVAGLLGQLPGVEPAPYIIRFTEDKPNPLYRRICYTFAWNAIICYALLNLVGLAVAVGTGKWYLRQIYERTYFPLAAIVVTLGAFGRLPRVLPSTKGEGYERRYFYGAVWAVCLAQPVLWLMWKALPREGWADILKLVIFMGILVVAGLAAKAGLMPRTRPIVPGELAVSD